MAKTGHVACPRCGRTVGTDDHYYGRHGVIPDSSDICPMSKRRVPISGTRAEDHTARAKLIARLAAEVQDEDPLEVWDYLTTLPGDEIQRLLQFALAAIPVDKTIHEIFGWVNDLPAAKEAC
jgi:hypothetical protein